MPQNTYVALQTTTVGTATNTVTFSSIPQGYTDLVVVVDATSAGDNVLARINGDTGSNYSFTRLSGNGSSATSARASNQSYLNFDGAAYLTTGRSTWVIQFMNYSNTTTFKTILSRGSNAATGTDANVNLWRSTSAITSIAFIATSNTYQTGSTFTLYGIAASSVGAKATGGDIYVDSQYFYHVFDANGTFTPTQSISADVLVVAGGGGGGGGGSTWANGGGGGAGGVAYYGSQSLTATGYTCTVGAGGSGGATYAKGASGINSSFGALSAAIAGGAGGGYSNGVASTGGSGGGGAGLASGGNTGAAGTSGQGNAGGNGVNAANDTGNGGGGGGAGGAGQAAGVRGSTFGGNGGDGTTSYTSWLTATGLGLSGAIAGGGGGGAGTVGNFGVATAGGGNGGNGNANGTNGLAYSGGGGGGCGAAGSGGGTIGGNGGSGVIIIRYAK
jgi:hypothetical protein